MASVQSVTFNQDASATIKHVIEYLRKMVPNKNDLIKIILTLLQEPETYQVKVPESDVQSHAYPDPQIYPDPQSLSKFDDYIQKPLCIKLDNNILRQENIIEVKPFSLENNDINIHFSEKKTSAQNSSLESNELNEPIELRQLFVRNLPFSTTKEILHNIFSRYGDLIDTRVQYESNNGFGYKSGYKSGFMKSKGFGFVTFQTMQSAQSALLDKNIMIEGRLIFCDLAVNGKYLRPPNKHYIHNY